MSGSAPKRRFGEVLRGLREEAGLRLGEFAERLGVSKTYLSDVELGRRAPFPAKTIRIAATLLGVDPHYLLAKAAEARGAFELEPVTPRHREAGMALMRRWSELDDDALSAIMKAIGAQEGDPDEHV